MKAPRMPASFVLAALLTAGCAYQTPPVRAPARMSAGPLEAADVQVADADGAATAELAADVRAEVAAMLARAVPPEAGAPTPVSVRVRILRDVPVGQEAMRQDGMAAIFLIPGIPFGQVDRDARVEVEVSYEIHGRMHTGHAVAARQGSIYAPARRRALAVALDRALARAADQASVIALP
jgi:hypothetical protein